MAERTNLEPAQERAGGVPVPDRHDRLLRRDRARLRARGRLGGAGRVRRTHVGGGGLVPEPEPPPRPARSRRLAGDSAGRAPGARRRERDGGGTEAPRGCQARRRRPPGPGARRLAGAQLAAPALRLRRGQRAPEGPRSGWTAASRRSRTRVSTARGEVGDADPLQAIEDSLRTFGADEIIISTHPEGRSNWLEKGVVSGAKQRFTVPITHVVVDLEAERAEATSAAGRAPI